MIINSGVAARGYQEEGILKKEIYYSRLKNSDLCNYTMELMGNLILRQIQTKRNFSRKFSIDLRGSSSISHIVE
jgi:hypothetical protein